MPQLTVGVDVGGTKVAAILVDESGTVLQSSRAETESTAYRSMVAGIVEAASSVSEGSAISSVGLAIAGNVAADRTHVLFSPHLPLAGEPLAADLAGTLGVPVLIENDANAAAWAEHET